jgi:hypothetical protein
LRAIIFLVAIIQIQSFLVGYSLPTASNRKIQTSKISVGKWRCKAVEPESEDNTGKLASSTPRKSDFDLALERLGSSRKRFITINLSALVIIVATCRFDLAAHHSVLPGAILTSV